MDEGKPPSSTEQPEDFAGRREFVRLSMLRANRSIGVILGVVLLLGVVLVFMFLRARKSQARAERAEAAETEKVWRASLAQARAENLSTRAGHRAAALEAVRVAAKIRPSMELRNEAIAALVQRDLVLEREWPMKPNAYGIVFDPSLEYYVTTHDETVLSMFRMSDNSHVRDFPLPFIYKNGATLGDFQFSSTGRYLVIRYTGGGLTLWEVDKALLLRVLSFDPRAERYSWPPTFSADDRLMGLSVTGSGGHQAVFDLEKGEVRPLPALAGAPGFTGYNTFRISPGGDLLACWNGVMILVYDAVTGEQKYSVRGQSTIEAVAWDPQGKRLSFSCDDWSVSIWEPVSGRVLPLGGRAHRPWLHEFSRDGNLLVTSGYDGMTRLWDIVSGRLVCEQSGLLASKLGPDGRHIGGGRAGRAVSVWRVDQPKALSLVRGAWSNRATAWQMDMTADGRLGVWSPPWWVGQGGYEVLDMEKGSRIFRSKKERVLAGFRPGHEQLWTTGASFLKIFPLPSGAAEEEPVVSLLLPAGFMGTNAAFSADGRYAAVSGQKRGLLVLDVDNPSQPPVTLEPVFSSADASLPGPASPTGGGVMAMSPDGRWVAAGINVEGGRPVVWDARTGKVSQRLTCGPGNVTFSPDGRFLAVVSRTSLACLSTDGWKVLWQSDRESMQTYNGLAAFNGDSSLLACSQGSGRVVFFTISGEAVADWDFRDLLFVSNLRFSADGGRLFVGGIEGSLACVDMRALRGGLADLKLDWPLPAAAPAPRQASGGAWMLTMLGLLPVAFAGLLGVLVLRRQGQLTHEFVEATEVASLRERELAAEREVSELKSRFVATVSHEFRTPLGITMSAVELLRHYEKRLPQEEKDQLFDDIHTATRNMAGLMEQVLVLGRVDAGKLAFKPAPLDLDALVEKLADEARSATSRKCPIEWTPENDLSGARADEALLRHIFTNLLSNGVKYSPAGSIVHFRARREGGMAVLSVEDSGIGIPEEEIPQLFEAFHRASNVGDIPGTGLGLVISKRCAELHGGGIQVKSKPGAGTIFTVRIPAW